MHTSVLHYASLEEDRLHGDPVADRFAADLIARHGLALPERLIETMDSGKPAEACDLREFPLKVQDQVQDYFQLTGQLPLWANKNHIQIAQQLFSLYGPEMMVVVLCNSLPYLLCCTHSPIKEILGSHGMPGPETRLTDDLQFFVEVMSPDSLWGSRARGMTSVQKTRLQRAVTRQMVLGAQKKYDTSAQGVPLNQEDMVAHVLALGSRVIEGLEGLGIHLTVEEKEAFLHFWNVVGYMLGVRQTLLPVSLPGAQDLARDILGHRAATSPEASERMKAGIDFMEKTVSGNKYNAIPLTVTCILCESKIREILQLKTSDQDLQNISWRFHIDQSDAQLLQADRLPFTHLANLFAKELVEGLLHYYPPHRNHLFYLPAERRAFWRSFHYSRKIPSYNEWRSLPEALKTSEDLVHFLTAEADSMGYFAIAYYSVLQKINTSLLRNEFNHPVFIHNLSLDLSSKTFERFNDYLNHKEPPFAWKLAIEAHLTHSYYIDQYWLSSIAVHLLHDLLPSFNAAAGDEPIEIYRDDFALIMMHYQQVLPEMTDHYLKNPSGLNLKLNPLVINKLNEDLEPLSHNSLWEHLADLNKKHRTRKKNPLEDLQALALELSNVVLHPSGLYNSVLKSYAKRETDHAFHLLQLLQAHS